MMPNLSFKNDGDADEPGKSRKGIFRLFLAVAVALPSVSLIIRVVFSSVTYTGQTLFLAKVALTVLYTAGVFLALWSICRDSGFIRYMQIALAVMHTVIVSILVYWFTDFF